MSAPPEPTPGNVPDWTRPRPIDASYWVQPGRLLVGEHPASRSRAQSMERLRRFLEAGVTCFVDLTEPDEMPGYEMLLPFETPAGRRVEYLREPITDHGVPAERETMARILAMIDGALAAGHCVYVHCRAGIGRSATVAGCWLAERNHGGGAAALVELADLWRQCTQSRLWREVPETAEQADYVRGWTRLPRALTGGRKAQSPRDKGNLAGPPSVGPLALALALAQRARGAWYGLALGDALGRSAAADRGALQWTQHTALTLCLADSLAAVERCDARDQIERYWRWFKQGHHAASGQAGETAASPDIAKALATWRWRGQPTAGSHDPKDDAPGSLARVLAAVMHAGHDVTGGIALAAECSRTTHQSPLILDACRTYAAMLAGALLGHAATSVLQEVPQPTAGCYGAKPLRKDVRTACTSPPGGKASALPEVLRMLVLVRRIVGSGRDFEAVIDEARRATGADGSSPLPALVGTLYGALQGFDALPADAVARLEGREQVEDAWQRSLGRVAGTGVPR